MKLFFLLSLLAAFNALTAQEKGLADTLETIIVNAYAHRAKLMNVAAPVNVIGKQQLDFGNEMSIVSAMNTLPGVNMEERSPGSYRINIRGSSQRSPFGVRNVKVYYQGIPMTDPGGNTYLQILGPYNISGIEVLKGPSGSMYGMGTGGVLLMLDVPSKNGLQASGIFGSNNANNILVSGSAVNDQGSINIKFNRQENDGYRSHTAMHRNVIAVNAALKTAGNLKLDVHFLYGEMYYQTPGALTLAEFQKNPMDARPRVGNSPSADEAKAAFQLNYVLAGFRLQQQLSTAWDNEIIVYGAYGQNRNPNFRNYSRTSEPHGGARMNFHFDKRKESLGLAADFGAEFQTGLNGQRVFRNNNGETGDLQTDDEIKSKQAFVYAQLKFDLKHDWSLTAGSSINFLSVTFQRFSTNGYKHHRNFNGLWMPRLAISKSFGKRTIFYGTVSRGFSPPSTSELLPSTDVFDKHLQPEHGINYELGWRRQAFANRFFADVSLFHFAMRNTIIQERDSTGGDYFINAGNTAQNGLEVLIRYLMLSNHTAVFNQISVEVSGTVYDFRFRNYKPLDKDYSGNQLPGTSSLKFAANADMEFRNGLEFKVSTMYRNRIPLNDANTAYANPFAILNLRVGYTVRRLKSCVIHIFTGSENVTNTTYSLGNDINAFGGRYYNAAPGRTYFAGISVNAFQFKKEE